MPIEQSSPLLISGNIVDTKGNASYGHVLVEQGVIVSVGAARPELPAGTVVFEAGPDAYVFPGLLNLHTHVDASLLPIWDNPLWPWDNRFEWLHNPGYQASISDPLASMMAAWETPLRGASGPSVGVALQTMAEIQAIAGGTTTLQESDAMLLGGPQTFVRRGHVLVRNTGVDADVGLASNTMIFIPNFFYQANPTPAGRPKQDTSAWVPEPTEALSYYRKSVTTSRLHANLVHLAEGRSGVGLYTEGVDPYSRTEFGVFMRDIQALDVADVRASNFNIIHGCGIDVFDPASIEFLTTYGINLVWSPVSNMLLYGDTTFAPALIAAGVTTSLGSDWSPGGSKHVWYEAKYARFLLRQLGIPVSDAMLYQMVTTQPARAVNLRAGQIAPECFGDFFVLRSPAPGMSPLEVLFEADDSHTRAVIVAGVAAYGDPDIFSAWGLTPQRLPSQMGPVASTKAVFLPPELNVNLDVDYTKLHELLVSQHVPQLSLPLVVDDQNYQNSMRELSEYTVRYAEQAEASPTSPISIWKQSR